MFPIYTVDALVSKSLSELRVIARQVGATIAGDLRRKATYAEAIVAHQQAAVELVESIVDEVVEEHEARVAADFIADQDEIIEQINILADALNFAILSDNYDANCPNIRTLEEGVAQLNLELEGVNNLHRKYIESLCCADADIEPEVDIDIWWQSNTNGAVSIDGGNSYRCFRVLDMLTNYPVIKLLVSGKKEIDSRWATTKSNRYIKTVLGAIPAHIQRIAKEIRKGDEVVDLVPDQQPPGRGDGRGGRIDEFGEF